MIFTVLLYTLGVFSSIVVCVFLGVVLYLGNIHHKYAHIPSPPRDSFFLGHMPNMREHINRKAVFADIMHQWMQKYGHTICLYFMQFAVVITVDPAAIKEFLISGSHPKHIVGYLPLMKIYGKYRFMGYGLVTEVDHSKWAQRRAILNPAFHRKFLKELMSDFNQTTDDLMRKLQGLADGKTQVSLLDEMNHVTMDIIGKVAFGKNIDSIHDDQSPFPQAIHTTMEAINDDAMYPFNKFLPVKLEFKKKVADAVKLLRETGHKWLEERLQALSKGEYVVEDIMSYVVQAYDRSDPESLEKCLDDIVTFFVAGQETTASTLSFLLLELGKRPEIFQKLQEEVDQVVGQKSAVTYDDLGKLEYLNQLLKETLRLYPPATLTFREACQDTTIQGYHIPQGTQVMINIFGVSRTAEFHSDPLEFKPDRFHKDSEERPKTYTYLPFSFGPRSCIGQHFAMIEAKVIIAKFMQHFELTLDPKQSFDIMQDLSLKPKDGTRATLTLRNK